MEEDEYVELQTLLTKLRVLSLKEAFKYDDIAFVKERDFKMVRYIDWIRKNMTIDFRIDSDKED